MPIYHCDKVTALLLHKSIHFLALCSVILEGPTKRDHCYKCRLLCLVKISLVLIEYFWTWKGFALWLLSILGMQLVKFLNEGYICCFNSIVQAFFFIFWQVVIDSLFYFSVYFSDKFIFSVCVISLRKLKQRPKENPCLSWII